MQNDYSQPHFPEYCIELKHNKTTEGHEGHEEKKEVKKVRSSEVLNFHLP